MQQAASSNEERHAHASSAKHVRVPVALHAERSQDVMKSTPNQRTASHVAQSTSQQLDFSDQAQDEPHLLHELPEPPKSFYGDSHHKGRNYKVVVSNQRGYLARVQLEAEFPSVKPHDLFKLLVNPNNAGVFRGVKDVGSRNLLTQSDDGKVRTLEVEQVGEARFMWIKRTFKTRLRVQEDETDVLRPRMTFSLIRSDLLSAFDGSWHIEPFQAPGGRHGTKAIMIQDVSPKGVPTFMKHMPLMGGVLRSGISRAVCVVAEDITSVMDMVREGLTVEEAMDEKKRASGATKD